VSFTAHNFELTPGNWTLPGAPEIGNEPLSASYLRTIREFCPPGARVADLGCLEGGYSVLLARAGYEVLGIEGQPGNFETCRRVAERVGLDNLSFAQDDVRNLGDHGSFDAVLCAGLLYHLDQPVSFLHELGRLTRRLLIVPTNFATVEGRELATFGDLLDDELSEHEARRGRWFGEIPGPWSSLGNPRSFWLERDDLLRTMIAAGFPTVFEQFDWIDDAATWKHLEDRKVAVFVGVKPQAQPDARAATNSPYSR
jgi:SAM-dependent methyltransferase